MNKEILWTVARFPNGSWATGGPPTDPDYALCEVWQILAPSREVALKRAQWRRSRQQKALRAGAIAHKSKGPGGPAQATRAAGAGNA